jgi:hypothetical protein
MAAKRCSGHARKHEEVRMTTRQFALGESDGLAGMHVALSLVTARQQDSHALDTRIRAD